MFKKTDCSGMVGRMGRVRNDGLASSSSDSSARAAVEGTLAAFGAVFELSVFWPNNGGDGVVGHIALAIYQ